MKKTILFYFFLTFILVLNSKAQTQNEAEMTFKNLNKKVGKLERNTVTSVSFLYKNTGNIPLIIKKIKASCDCTVVHYSKAPLLPEKSDTIVVKFKSATAGRFSRNIDIFSNSKDSPTQIHISGKVIAKKQE